MRFPVTLYKNNLSKFILTIAWFGLVPFLLFNLLPELVLNFPLLPWPGSLFLGLSLALVLIPLLQKYGFIDPDRLLRCSINYAVLSVAFLGLYMLIRAVLRLLSPGRQPDPNESLFFFLLAAVLVVRPLLDLIQIAVNRYVLRNRPDYQTLLCDISSRIATALYLPDLLKMLTAELPERLMITNVGLMIIEEKRSRLYPEDLRFGSSLWSESRLISLLRNGNQYFFCKPVLHDPQLSRELMEIRQAGFSLVYGLPGSSQFGGLLLLGSRRDSAPYSRRDVQVFSTLANQVNIALENALNYETLSESKEQLQMVYDKLVQAEKMAALGELTTVLAHELKNPLGIIRGSAQFLASSPRSVEMQQELLHYIMDEVDTLNLVINNFLGLARQKPPLLRQVDLRRELTAFIYQWQQSSDHNRTVDIILSTPEHLPVMYADSKQLRQVLLNCIVNSEEVMPDGGIIKISAREMDGEQIEIVVTDTGPGITEENIKLVFKKFFTTKKKGMGLGLPVCRQIIRSHNGNIQLMNRSGGGLQVVIRLPQRPLVTVGHGPGSSAVDETNTILRKLWSSEY